MRILLLCLIVSFFGCGEDDETSESGAFDSYNWAALDTVPTPVLAQKAEGSAALTMAACMEPAATQLKGLFDYYKDHAADDKPTVLCDGSRIEPGVLYQQAPTVAEDPSIFPIEIHTAGDNQVTFRRCDPETRRITKITRYSFGSDNKYRVDTVAAEYRSDSDTVSRHDYRFMLDKEYTTNATVGASFGRRNLAGTTYDALSAFEAIGFNLSFDGDGIGTSILKNVLVPNGGTQETSVEELLYLSVGGRKDFVSHSMNAPETRYFDADAFRIAESDADQSVRNHEPDLTLPTGADDTFFGMDLFDEAENCEGDVVFVYCPEPLPAESSGFADSALTASSQADGCD